MLVTAIMPTWNRAGLIGVAINCFLRQTYQDAELLIVDDGDDSTASLIPQHERIRYVKLEGPKLNTGAKRNKCCELANGDVIIHWDSDDWSAATRIERQVEMLLKSGKQMAGYHSLHYYEVKTGRAYRYSNAHPPYASGTSQCYFRAWWTGGHKFQPNKQIGEDASFCFLAKRDRELYSEEEKEVMVIARTHSANTSQPKFVNKAIFVPIDRGKLPDQFYKDLECTSER
jgi:O-antigen biosynthesis protein